MVGDGPLCRRGRDQNGVSVAQIEAVHCIENGAMPSVWDERSESSSGDVITDRVAFVVK